MPDASPAKWHLAHTSWFFETFLLMPGLKGYEPFHPQFKVLFNSYYVSVGERHPRPERGLLSRPSLDEVLEYRRYVDLKVQQWLDLHPSEDLLDIFELGVNHEQQHQELILTDIKHLLSRNPLHPVYGSRTDVATGPVPPMQWIGISGGLREVGWDGRGFSFDNECPRHQQYVQEFEMASRPVSNRDYREFIDDGGYRRPELWLSDGWEACQRMKWDGPLYWQTETGHQAFTLNGLRPLDEDAPVCHVSYYEADAYARWAQARLPTEAEWESAAASVEISGNFAESGWYQPVPDGRGQSQLRQMFGDVWEWTASAYLPYPGFRQADGAVGEYNGKFMVNQLVLRGGSCATPQTHMRKTYRNFFAPPARWQFSGIRLARNSATR